MHSLTSATSAVTPSNTSGRPAACSVSWRMRELSRCPNSCRSGALRGPSLQCCGSRGRLWWEPVAKWVPKAASNQCLEQHVLPYRLDTTGACSTSGC